jgi:hypothetical protein
MDMSERVNVVLVPTPRTPESALNIQVELEREPKEPWEMALLSTLEHTLEEITRLRAMSGSYLLGINPAMNLPPAPTALPHILTAIASLSKSIATVIESQIGNMEKMANKEEVAYFVARVIGVGYRLYHAFGMTVAEYISTVVHGLVSAQSANSLALGTFTGMMPFKTEGEVAVQQERR